MNTKDIEEVDIRNARREVEEDHVCVGVLFTTPEIKNIISDCLSPISDIPNLSAINNPNSGVTKRNRWTDAYVGHKYNRGVKTTQKIIHLFECEHILCERYGIWNEEGCDRVESSMLTINNFAQGNLFWEYTRRPEENRNPMINDLPFVFKLKDESKEAN